MRPAVSLHDWQVDLPLSCDSSCRSLRSRGLDSQSRRPDEPALAREPLVLSVLQRVDTIVHGAAGELAEVDHHAAEQIVTAHHTRTCSDGRSDVKEQRRLH